MNLQQTPTFGYDKQTAEKYTTGQHEFFNIENVEDGATLEMEKRIYGLERQHAIQTVADLGCGSNLEYLRLWQKSSRADVVIGVEPSPYMREILSQELSQEQKSNIRVLEGNWVNSNLKTNSIDLVVSRFSLHNIKNIAHGYNELSRILKPGGHAIISLPHPDYCKKELEEKGLRAIEGTPMEVNVFDTVLQYFYHNIETYLGRSVAVYNLMVVEHQSLNWGTKNNTESNIPNTLIFTLKKLSNLDNS